VDGVLVIVTPLVDPVPAAVLSDVPSAKVIDLTFAMDCPFAFKGPVNTPFAIGKGNAKAAKEGNKSEVRIKMRKIFIFGLFVLFSC
jgi:hypothetical protein